VRTVPEGYLPVSSGLGRATPRELLVAPLSDGTVQAVIELGFLRRVEAADLELLARISEPVAMAVRSAHERARIDALLEETQRQAEELQAQQEELRSANEELEQSEHTLRQSHTQLEAQQVELEHSNQQLEEQTHLLERASRYKSEFLANMSHELRTPLNSALILAKILADNRAGTLSAEQVRYAETIVAAGTDLLALINDILDLSKIEAGRVDVTPQPVRIARLLDELVRTFAPLAAQKGLALRTSIATGSPEMLETDRLRLTQILRNLISNAIKFTERGEITLEVAGGTADGVSFTVRDTGIGIAASEHETIFEAFRQVNGSTERQHGGTGLGLTIARDLARLLQGDVSLESAPGRGSAFTVSLPLRLRAALSPIPAAAARLRSWQAGGAAAIEPGASAALAAPEIEDDRAQLHPGDRSLLIVEDDAQFATILRDLGRELGFRCIVAGSAAAAVAAALRHQPAAIVLDLNLPDNAGLGLLDQFKHNPSTRHIPVHVISASDFHMEALMLGAVGYSLKPVQRHELVQVFERLRDKAQRQVRRVLLVEADARERDSIQTLLSAEGVEIQAVSSARAALEALRHSTFDCMVLELRLPDMSGMELLRTMSEQEDTAFPPTIVHTGGALGVEEQQQLRRYSQSVILKDVRSPERLLDEVTLFLHTVETGLPSERQRLLRLARDRDAKLEGRRILIVEDDVRNVFALANVLEPKGATIEIARNGREALTVLERHQAADGHGIDLVLMDLMMPEMDGLTAIAEIRKRPEWRKLPVIALTAKAMADDRLAALAAGANDYIRKPIDVDRLLSLVRVWISQ
jgi:signal transduction histidine kinase/DNA-binding response OmpR family regulator